MVGIRLMAVDIRLITVLTATILLFASSSVRTDASEPALSESEPDITTRSSENPPEPMGWSGDEFLISYDEAGMFDAKSPDIAIAPTGTPWAGSIHSVWAEKNNSNEFPFAEIHYSKSDSGSAGHAWSNDEISEGDKLISEDRTANGDANPGNASNPSIAIDLMGWLHVVWVEQYPDWTYEIHYSRSENNGVTWSGFDLKSTGGGDILVSSDTGQDGLWINQPRIAVTSSPLTVHVVWDEVSNTGDTSNVWYAKSTNQGSVWSEQVQINMPAAPGISPPSNPDIATSGPGGEIVHIIWTQEFEISPGLFAEDIYYARSMTNGDSWQPARAISQITPNTSVDRPRLSAVNSNVFAVWPQYDYSIPGSNPELYYSASADNGDMWNGELQENMISFPDGHEAINPAISSYIGPGGTEVHAVWVETDEMSPLGTQEIHHSKSCDPMNPMSWTGSERDIVLSVPDDAEFAEAQNASVSVGFIGGEVRPQVVWEEKNVAGAGGKVDRNNEIHYLPDMTFEVPVHLGWNLISVPLVQDNSSVIAVLDDSSGDGNTEWDVIKWYDPLTPSDPWKTYRAGGTANDLSEIDTSIGFWINVTAVGDGNLTVFGDYANATQISLYAGWNLVGYPAQASKNITASLGSTHDLPVEGYDSNSTYMISQFSGSYMMKPGEGYWIHVAADTVWTINW